LGGNFCQEILSLCRPGSPRIIGNKVLVSRSGIAIALQVDQASSLGEDCGRGEEILLVYRQVSIPALDGLLDFTQGFKAKILAVDRSGRKFEIGVVPKHPIIGIVGFLVFAFIKVTLC
jgi:hypothetical protein